MEYRAASRFDEKYKEEKCPHCHRVGLNFMLLDDGILACTVCRGVFISKEVMSDFKSKLKGILKTQGQDRSAWVCEHPGCNFGENGGPFRAKTKSGLTAHMRKHDNAGISS